MANFHKFQVIKFSQALRKILHAFQMPSIFITKISCGFQYRNHHLCVTQFWKIVQKAGTHYCIQNQHLDEIKISSKIRSLNQWGREQFNECCFSFPLLSNFSPTNGLLNLFFVCLLLPFQSMHIQTYVYVVHLDFLPFIYKFFFLFFLSLSLSRLFIRKWFNGTMIQ